MSGSTRIMLSVRRQSAARLLGALLFVATFGAGCNLGPEHYPLHEAALRGDAQAVERLLAKGVNPNKGNGYTTPLMAAAEAGSVEVIDLLLRAGADPNKKTEDGDTALTWLAVNNDKAAAAERLIGAGVDPCAVSRLDTRAKPAAKLAEERGHHAVAKYLTTQSTRC